jgi:hypothetical protein
MLNLNDMSDNDFEELCYDLLKSIGFINLSWRKGTGLSSSPSDQGRDIQAEYVVKDFNGNIRIEKYFIECKHHLKGVSPDKIMGALSWAAAERPDELIIFVSNWLSNPTKNYIEDYKKNNNPFFRIKVLENKDIENILINKIDLQNKYKINCEISSLKYVNKYHIIYAIKLKLNTSEYLIKLMDELDAVKRDKAFRSIYISVIKPRVKTPIPDNVTVNELFIDKVDYNNFRKAILSKDYDYNEIFGFICSMLALIYYHGDIGSIDDSLNQVKSFIEDLEKELPLKENIEKNEDLKFIIDLKKQINDIPKIANEYYEIYNYICDNLVRKLLLEKPTINDNS